VSGELHAMAALTSREIIPGTPWIGGWMGIRASMDAVAERKITSLSLPTNETRLSSP